MSPYYMPICHSQGSDGNFCHRKCCYGLRTKLDAVSLEDRPGSSNTANRSQQSQTVIKQLVHKVEKQTRTIANVLVSVDVETF